MPTQCSICLSEYKDPVSIPCGHIYCTNCLSDHVNVPSNQGFTSTCPTCRTPFTTVNPDLTYLPRKYHQYILPSVRRVYPTLVQDTNDTRALTILKSELTNASQQIHELKNREEQLLRQCERYRSASNAHRVGERDALVKVREAEAEIEELSQELDELKAETGKMEVKASIQTREAELSAKLVKELADLCEKLEIDAEYKALEIEGLQDEITILKRKNAGLKQQLKSSQPTPPSSAPLSSSTRSNTQSSTTNLQQGVPERKIRPLPKRLTRARSASPPPSNVGEALPKAKKPRISEGIPSKCTCGKHHAIAWRRGV